MQDAAGDLSLKLVYKNTTRDHDAETIAAYELEKEKSYSQVFETDPI
jgi:hypothetical protein